MNERVMQTRINRLKHIKLLDNTPIQDIKHLGWPLKEHLVGTYDLLVSWKNSEDVCLAGLFHSIYGTKTFRNGALKTGSRRPLRDLIGEYAEYLVFVFGMSDRKHLLLDNPSAPHYWVDYRTGNATEIASDAFSHLVEIEVANFIEQMPFLTGNSGMVIRDMRDRFDSTSHRMSVGAQEAFHRAFTGAGEPSVSEQRHPKESR